MLHLGQVFMLANIEQRALRSCQKLWFAFHVRSLQSLHELYETLMKLFPLEVGVRDAANKEEQNSGSKRT